MEVVKLLLAKDGVNVNEAHKDGWTPLHIASQNGHAKVVQLLLTHEGVNVNQAQKDGWTPDFTVCGSTVRVNKK